MEKLIEALKAKAFYLEFIGQPICEYEEEDF
jgi:hypothetical protein